MKKLGKTGHTIMKPLKLKNIFYDNLMKSAV